MNCPACGAELWWCDTCQTYHEVQVHQTLFGKMRLVACPKLQKETAWLVDPHLWRQKL